MFKKLVILFSILFFFLIPSSALAQENEVSLYFFWSKTCPHCEKEQEFLNKIAPEYPDLKIYDFEVSKVSNFMLLQEIGRQTGVSVNGVPIVFISDSNLIGYLNDETSGQTIISLIEKAQKEGDKNQIGEIVDEFQNPQATPLPTSTPLVQQTPSPTPSFSENTSLVTIPDEIKIPLIGTKQIKSLSLPILTIVLAAMDGFNPCAMWVLLFLISLLLGMKDTKRMWILGITFIASSALVYFLFLSAWLNLFLFLGFITWIRVVVGLFALGAGSYYLYDYHKNKSAECKVTGGEKKQKIFEKLKTITQKKQLLLALGGIILLAFAVNLVELICSAGLPAIFTQVLSLSDMPTWKYYSYLVLYVLIFMLDDLIVFFVAMITLRVTGFQNKYSRLSHLIGGILMLIIGILLIVKPELLTFG